MSFHVCISSLQDPAETMNNEDFLRLVAQYKFTLAFENAIGDDYITEKLWRPLIVGSVPVYLGSPSIKVCPSVLITFFLDPNLCIVGLGSERRIHHSRAGF